MVTSAEQLVLPALRGHFGDWVYYSCLMPLAEVGARADYAHQVHPTKELSEFIQRSLEGVRASHIAQYLEKTPDRFFNSLVLAVYGGAPEWLDVGGFRATDPSLRQLLSPEAEDSVGFLHLNGREAIFAIDGQHRLAGIRKALANGQIDGAEQVPVILVGHKKTATGLQRTRRLFTTLNKTAVPVRKRDIIALDEDDAMAIIVRRMVETDARFADPRIAIVASQNIPNHNTVALTTISSLYDLLKLLFVHDSGRGSDRGLRFNRPTNDKLDHYFELATSYFTTLGATFKPVREVLTAAAPGVVTPKYRHARGGHLLFRPIGLDMFTKTVIRCASARGLSLESAIKRLKSMPMQLTDAPYSGVIWDPTRGVMRPPGKVVAREVMAYMAGLIPESRSLVESYRSAQGRPKSDASITLPDRLKF